VAIIVHGSVSNNDPELSRKCSKTYYYKHREKILKKRKDGDKEKRNAYQRAWYKKYKNEEKNKRIRQYFNDNKEHIMELRKKNYKKRLWRAVKRRAKTKNIPFNITPDDIIMPEKCKYLGIKLINNVGCGTAMHNSPSIDRIENEKGYIKGNIQVISYRANACKQNLSLEQLKIFARNILKLHTEEREA